MKVIGYAKDGTPIRVQHMSAPDPTSITAFGIAAGIALAAVGIFVVVPAMEKWDDEDNTVRPGARGFDSVAGRSRTYLN